METPATSELRVLVVDGDESVLHLVETKLTRAGFSVGTVSDGEEGLFKAQAFEPHAAIVGDGLGPFDGYALARAIADLPFAPVVIFLSADDDDEAVEHALRAGCDDYVLKPFSPHELVHRVRVALMRRRARSEENR